MDFVLTLVTNPDTRCLDKADVATARAALAALGAVAAAPDWLAPDIACDIAFAGAPPPLARAAVAAALAYRPIDLHAQPAAGRRKRLLVADMDSTIVTSETLDELAEHAGVKEQIAAITRRSMNGEIDFAAALRERVAMIAGLPVDALAATLARTELTAGAVALVRTMRAAGAHTALVSGGFRYFTRSIAARCGFDEEAANDLVVAEGRLTGAVVEPILTRDTKLETLRRLAAARGLAPDDTLAVGDGANDLPMLVAAGLGVAFRAKPIVAAAAGCRVDHGDLTALLYLQGYRQAELVGEEPQLWSMRSATQR
jgi:phosphoserine phosphatase